MYQQPYSSERKRWHQPYTSDAILDQGIMTMIRQVWRQDDNGNRFLVGIFTSKEAADMRIAELTQSHHKQTYWISELLKQNVTGE